MLLLGNSERYSFCGCQERVINAHDQSSLKFFLRSHSLATPVQVPESRKLFKLDRERHRFSIRNNISLTDDSFSGQYQSHRVHRLEEA